MIKCGKDVQMSFRALIRNLIWGIKNIFENNIMDDDKNINPSPDENVENKILQRSYATQNVQSIPPELNNDSNSQGEND